MTAKEKILSRLQKGLHICVGLDSDINKIPKHLLNDENAILNFNKEIIEKTHDIAAAYKINFAFYEKEGENGFKMLAKTLSLIPNDILVIGDAKRGDIGNTSEMYAQAMFDHFKLDSSTLNPYMGYDSLSPFINYKENIHFILALTSNPGSFDFEKLELTNGKKVYQEVIAKVNQWNSNNNLGIVFGATNLDELKENIQNFENLFVLLPGVGAQGGDLEAIVTAFKENLNSNFLINVSRALIYADNTEKFASESRKVLEGYNEIINKILKAQL
jgi:orotidine-5'-phosphate decarboxylase